MATFVLVGGAWLGGWAWDGVTRRLRQAGHNVYPVTLTGLGERKHLARPEVGLETHISDIVNVIEAEELRDVILVGHSYGGVPVTGAADRVAERIASAVYVDSGPIPVDTAYIEFDPESRDATEQQVAREGDGWLLPPMSRDDLIGAIPDLDPERVSAIQARMTPQPFATYTEPLRLKNPARAWLPKVAILNSFPESAVREMMAAGHRGALWAWCHVGRAGMALCGTADEPLADVLAAGGAGGGAGRGGGRVMQAADVMVRLGLVAGGALD